MTSIWSASKIAALSGAMRVPISDGPTSVPQYADLGQIFAYVGGTVNALDYGVKPDGMNVTDFSVVSGSPAVTSLSYQFVAADVGKLIVIRNAATTTTPIAGFIGSVTNGVASLVTTAGGSTPVNAGRTTSALAGTFGTDNQVALEAAGSAAASRAAAIGLATVVDLPAGIICHGDGLTCRDRVSWRGKGMYASLLKYITREMGTATFVGLSGSNGAPYTDCRFTDFGVDLDDVMLSAYAVTKKAFYIQFMYRAFFQRLWVTGTPASSLGVDYLVDSVISDNVIHYAGRMNVGAPGGGAIGIATSDSTAFTIAPGVTKGESCIVANNTIYASKRWGIFFEIPSGNRSAGIFTVVGNTLRMTAISEVALGDCGGVGVIWANNRVEGVGVGVGLGVQHGTVSGSRPGIQGMSIGNVFKNLGRGYFLDFGDGTPTTPLAADYTFADKIIGMTDHSVYAISSTNAGGAVVGLDFGRTTVIGGAKSGFYFTGTAPFRHLNFTGATIKNNGTGGVAPRAGIHFAAPADIVLLQTADIYDDQTTPTQSYGVEVAAGFAVTNARLPSYNFEGHVSGSIGGTGTLTGTKQTTAAYP